MTLLRKLWMVFCVALIVCLVAPTVAPANPGVFATAQAASKVKLNKSKASIYNGKTLQLKLSGTKAKATWSSSDKKIATVSQKGLVTAKKAGSAKITAKVGKKKYTCKLTVKPALSIKKSKLSIDVGDSGKVAVTYPLKGEIKSKSSDKKVATCAVKKKNGGYELVVTGKKAGKATITLTNSLTKDKATLKVTVNKAVSKRMELYGYLGKDVKALNADLTDKLTEVKENTFSNGVVEIYFDDYEEAILSIMLLKADDRYQLYGVYVGMTVADAVKAAEAYGWKKSGSSDGEITFEGPHYELTLEAKDDRVTFVHVIY